MASSNTGFHNKRNIIRNKDNLGINNTINSTNETNFDGKDMKTTHHATSNVRNPYASMFSLNKLSEYFGSEIQPETVKIVHESLFRKHSQFTSIFNHLKKKSLRND